MPASAAGWSSAQKNLCKDAFRRQAFLIVPTRCCKAQGFAGVLKNISWHLDFVKGLIIDIPWFSGAGKLSADHDANKRMESPIAEADATE